MKGQATTVEGDHGKSGFNPTKARPDVARTKKTQVTAVGLLLVCGWGFNSGARGQAAIAFVPGIGAIPSGETLTVTPAVSADRRYVRLSVDAFFNSFNGFTPFNVQGAVGGGGGLGGFGGLAGMNGVMGQVGFGGAGSGMSASAFFGPGAEALAGPVPFPGGLAELGPPRGDPLNPDAATQPNAWPEREAVPDEPAGFAEPAPQGAGNGRGVRAANRHVPRQHRTSPRKSTRRPSSAAQGSTH